MLALLDSYPADCENALGCYEHEERDKDVLYAGVADDSIRNMLDVLRREGEALSTLNEHHYEAIKDTYKNNIRLMRTFLPRRFDGDILLLVASESEAKPPHEIWSPYVSGRIKVHWIDCTHEAMMDPLPAAKIGNVLATELDKQRTTPRTQRRTT